MKVCNGSEEIEAQPKAFPWVSVSAAQDADAFEITQGVFHADAARGKSMVLLSLLGRESLLWSTQLALFVGCLAVGVEFVDALIAGVAQQLHVR